MDQVAARLAGGFIQPIDPDALQDAVKAALASTSLGELEGIKQLPGMIRAAVNTLDKVWHANIDLSARTKWLAFVLSGMFCGLAGALYAIHLFGIWASCNGLSLFNKDLRGLLQVAPDYMKPVRYDARKLQGLLGPPQMTSYDAGIGQTLAWIESGR
jgi:hypothetical protein